MVAELERLWEKLPFESEWYADNELARHRDDAVDLRAVAGADTRSELTEVGTEVDVDGVLDWRRQPAVRVRGRLDRLERDGEGRLVVVDVKTGKSPVSKDDAQRHAQLAMYQLAIAEGVAAARRSARRRPAGLSRQDRRGRRHRTRTGPADRRRPRQWREQVQHAAAATRGPQFVARVNDGCAHCPVRPMLPGPGRAEEVGR